MSIITKGYGVGEGVLLPMQAIVILQTVVSGAVSILAKIDGLVQTIYIEGVVTDV